MEIETIVSFLTQIIIFFGLYMSIFWILVLINSRTIIEKKKLKDIVFPKISIIVPAYNEEDGIEKTIKSLLNLNYPNKVEIIIVNDASTDKTINKINKFSSKIKIIDKKKNAGKAAAINSGLKIAKGDFIGVVDADSEVSRNSLKNLIQHFYYEGGENIGAVISRMKPTNESKNLLERIQLMEYMFVGLIRHLFSSLRVLHLTPGVLSVYRKDLLIKLGGFDKTNITEDFEVAVRVRKSGYLIKFARDSEVYTTTPNQFNIFLKQRIRWARGFIRTHLKHRDIFFKKKYGIFGIYQFPMNILSPFIYFLAIFAIVFNMYKMIYEFLFKLLNTPDVINWFTFTTINEIILTYNPKIGFLIFTSFTLMMLLIYSVFKIYNYNFFSKDTFKKIIAFIVYIMFFNYIYIYVWSVSIFKEMKREKYNWGTK